jgi:hypothetical protein
MRIAISTTSFTRMWTRAPPHTNGKGSPRRKQGARRSSSVKVPSRSRSAYGTCASALRLRGVARDARYGARVLWRSPGYAAVVILTIALGIGVNAATFSVVHAVLWRSLPYPDAGRIVAIEGRHRVPAHCLLGIRACFRSANAESSDHEHRPGRRT